MVCFCVMFLVSLVQCFFMWGKCGCVENLINFFSNSEHGIQHMAVYLSLEVNNSLVPQVSRIQHCTNGAGKAVFTHNKGQCTV